MMTMMMVVVLVEVEMAVNFVMEGRKGGEREIHERNREKFGRRRRRRRREG
ncbi:Uncharacterized protein TCM_042806 [Theobroma cacao]|uniref:Uncharacterized protein n=1 Tax=Theobroma cacao TaxID=3641 RepID=A0A061FMC9_THECC|nr:Uncharacterized protein TCM_042806 [Theobroma cacao]